MRKDLFEPKLGFSQLSFRIGMARKRLASYPLDSMDFIMTNLERPELCSSHGHWWTGDLSGRILEALTVSEGIDGVHDPRLNELFSRILRSRQPNGLFGRYGQEPEPTPHEKSPISGSDKLFTGLLRYYFATGDFRALDAAKGIGEYLLKHKDAWLDACFQPDKPAVNHCWVLEPLAMLYKATNDKRYEEIIRTAYRRMSRVEGCHTHGYLTALRGLQLMALYTGDRTWNELPERVRRMIIDRKWQSPSGDVCESLPFSARNEGCAVSDWLMLNLLAGEISGEDEPYAQAEHILWNALFFNQIVTGGSGHRQMIKLGYGTGEFQEAWWCCTETSLLAMTVFARHVVTLKDGCLRINFLVQGEYRLGDMLVRISTNWPAKAEARIEVYNLPENVRTIVRIPESVHSGAIDRHMEDGVLILTLEGMIGHELSAWGDKYILKYGPLVLAPSNYTWQGIREKAGNAIPGGYVDVGFPSMHFEISLPPKDERGFLAFPLRPLPLWTFFDEGPDSRTSYPGVSVNVKIRFENSEEHIVRFWPLCYNISTLTLYPVPLLFDVKA